MNPSGRYLPGENPYHGNSSTSNVPPTSTSSIPNIVALTKTSSMIHSSTVQPNTFPATPSRVWSSSASSAWSSITSTTFGCPAASPSPRSSCYFWMEDIDHQGISAFGTSGYTVFRNVKDYGSQRDGVSDDTAAINAAISDGGRCAPGRCGSSKKTPAVIYFPAGTYLVSAPIIDYYYTQIIGNPNCVPTIKASGNFSGAWVIDGDQYQPGGVLGCGSTNVFWRQIRNFVIDITLVPASTALVGIHWPTAQATSLQKIVFKMSDASGTLRQGVFIESGSGSFMIDLTFYGSNIGAYRGNQQFTTRNLTFYDVVTAITQICDNGATGLYRHKALKLELFSWNGISALRQLHQLACGTFAHVSVALLVVASNWPNALRRTRPL